MAKSSQDTGNKKKEKEKSPRRREKILELKGKIFSHLKIKRNLTGKKHMLGIDERNRKNG